jgi:hypothetical protein
VGLDLEEQTIKMQSLHVPTGGLHGSRFPLSSPGGNDTASPRSCRTGTTYRSREPSQSPYSEQGNPFADDESDTSGQDEFHLERYSQPAEQSKRLKDNSSRLPSASYRERSESPRKRPRPGLNIVTDFAAATPTTSRRDNIVLDEVPNQRPQLGDRAVTSVVSQKAEHFYQPAQKDTKKQAGFVSLDDIKRKIKRRDSNIRIPFGGKLTTQLTKSSASRHTPIMQDDSRVARSIVIGISVPEDQAQHHKPKDLSSALSLYTPATPQIVVTPAEEEAPWSRPVSTPRRRPTSSVYSHKASSDRPYQADEDAPPVPYLAKTKAFHFVTQTKADPRSEQFHPPEGRHRPDSTDTIFDDQDDIAIHNNHHITAGSDDETIPLTGDAATPKSKGWWDLALTPMLSRAGTVFAKRSPSESSTVPPLPSKSPYVDQARELHESFEEPLLSPETPRRIGMGHSQISTAGWMDWTELKQERDRPTSSAHSSGDDTWKRHKAQESSATVPFMIGQTPIVHGLAAEYFTACAFEERSLEPYFECQNHSCAEKLPKLLSLYDRGMDRGMLVDIPSLAPESTAARDLALEKLQGNEPTTPRARSDSDLTAIEDDPAEFSPNMRSANVATIVKPIAFQPTKALATKPPDHASKELEEVSTTKELPEQTDMPLPTQDSLPARPVTEAATFGAALGAVREPVVLSPGPLSPEAQRDIAPQGAVQMSEMSAEKYQAVPQPITINHYSNYPVAPLRPEHLAVSLADIERRGDYQHPPKEETQQKDKPKKNYFGWLSCLKRKKDVDDKKKKKRMCICLIFWGLLAIVIACIVLAITLTRKGDNTPIDTQWLNLTGFPPMPTGISTVIRPDVLNADDSCVSPNTLWSCAVPKEQASEIAPNDPDQPNLRFEIRFHNGTSGVDPADTIPLNGTGTAPTAEDPFTNDLFIPNPAPPSDKEQIFLGNTTDNITAPFDGEVTPFFITFITAFPVVPPGFNDTASRLVKRGSSNTSLTLPSPSTTSNGTPAPAQLLPQSPYPSSQPLRLYNRGLPSEHYGFYTYYDKTIFLSTNSITNNTDGSSGVLPNDQNGGSFASSADGMCTFSQTRFLVRIFTNPASGLSLLPSSQNKVPGSNAKVSAFDYDTPGSFPWPMQVTIDRHGGDTSKKAVFCYEMQGGRFVQPLAGILQAEFRGAGGTLINPASSLITGSENGSDPSEGGFDGGTGGCACDYGNFVGSVG